MATSNIILIVGARPNFMKSAPLMRALTQRTDIFDTKLIHTGQHYDHKLSKLFFDELKMPEPDYYLGVGSDTHARQTAKIMIELEKNFTANQPDLVVVFGDVNSTLAASLVASKMGIKLAHVEAGLRSFDMSMPEEINRIVTDRLSDYLFVSEESGVDNLKNEGVPDEKIFYTGNIMIDSLVSNLEKAGQSEIISQLKLEAGNYVTMTMHRPSNVDSPDTLKQMLEAIVDVSREIPVVFPCHPRTKQRIEDFNIPQLDSNVGLKIIEPLGYLDFLKLQSSSKAVLTDSGGVQEETTFLKIPCITMRDNTERPSTVSIGTNVLIGSDPDKIRKTTLDAVNGNSKKGEIPHLWDGHTAERIVQILDTLF